MEKGKEIAYITSHFSSDITCYCSHNCTYIENVARQSGIRRLDGVLRKSLCLVMLMGKAKNIIRSRASIM